MSRRLYVIEKPFPASMGETKGSERVFKPGETLWWDGKELSNPVVFEVDNIPFQAELEQFLASVHVPS
jgi:hypothetical protein